MEKRVMESRSGVPVLIPIVLGVFLVLVQLLWFGNWPLWRFIL